MEMHGKQIMHEKKRCTRKVEGGETTSAHGAVPHPRKAQQNQVVGQQRKPTKELWKHRNTKESHGNPMPLKQWKVWGHARKWIEAQEKKKICGTQMNRGNRAQSVGPRACPKEYSRRPKRGRRWNHIRLRRRGTCMEIHGKKRCTRKRKQGVGSYMAHLRGGSLHVWGCTERRDARGKGDAVAPELSLWTKCMPKRTQQDAKKRKEVRQDQTTAPWHQSSVCGPKACLKRHSRMPKRGRRSGTLCWLRVIGVVVSHPLSMQEALGSIPYMVHYKMLSGV